MASRSAFTWASAQLWVKRLAPKWEWMTERSFGQWTSKVAPVNVQPDGTGLSPSKRWNSSEIASTAGRWRSQRAPRSTLREGRPGAFPGRRGHPVAAATRCAWALVRISTSITHPPLHTRAFSARFLAPRRP